MRRPKPLFPPRRQQPIILSRKELIDAIGNKDQERKYYLGIPRYGSPYTTFVRRGSWSARSDSTTEIPQYDLVAPQALRMLALELLSACGFAEEDALEDAKTKAGGDLVSFAQQCNPAAWRMRLAGEYAQIATTFVAWLNGDPSVIPGWGGKWNAARETSLEAPLVLPPPLCALLIENEETLCIGPQDGPWIALTHHGFPLFFPLGPEDDQSDPWIQDILSQCNAYTHPEQQQSDQDKAWILLTHYKASQFQEDARSATLGGLLYENPAWSNIKPEGDTIAMWHEDMDIIVFTDERGKPRASECAIKYIGRKWLPTKPAVVRPPFE